MSRIKRRRSFFVPFEIREEIVFERFRGFVIEGKKCENFLHPCEHFMENMKDFFQKERYVSVQTMRF